MKWKLCTHFGKNWYHENNHLSYDIQLLPSISLSYDSVMDRIDSPETTQLTMQWLIWHFAIWFKKNGE